MFQLFQMFQMFQSLENYALHQRREPGEKLRYRGGKRGQREGEKKEKIKGGKGTGGDTRYIAKI